jgi:hypothetical protein
VPKIRATPKAKDVLTRRIDSRKPIIPPDIDSRFEDRCLKKNKIPLQHLTEPDCLGVSFKSIEYVKSKRVSSPKYMQAKLIIGGR